MAGNNFGLTGSQLRNRKPRTFTAAQVGEWFLLGALVMLLIGACLQ